MSTYSETPAMAPTPVMSPAPVYVYPSNPEPQAQDPQFSVHLGVQAGGPQAIPNPQFQTHASGHVYPQQAFYPQAVQMQQPPVARPQLRPTPIGGLNSGPAPVCCPACGVVGLTAISFVAGEATQ